MIMIMYHHLVSPPGIIIMIMYHHHHHLDHVLFLCLTVSVVIVQFQGQVQQYVAQLIEGMPKKCSLPRFEYGSTGNLSMILDFICTGQDRDLHLICRNVV